LKLHLATRKQTVLETDVDILEFHKGLDPLHQAILWFLQNPAVLLFTDQLVNNLLNSFSSFRIRSLVGDHYTLEFSGHLNSPKPLCVNRPLYILLLRFQLYMTNWNFPNLEKIVRRWARSALNFIKETKDSCLAK
jgi:hypothetical protein